MSLIHQIALTQVPGVGSVTARALISHFKSAEVVFEASASELSQVSGIGLQIAKNIRNFDEFKRVEEELTFIEKHQIKTLFITDQAYPRRLSYCDDAPILLYHRGQADLNAKKIISVVGTRSATAYGKELCESLMEALKPHDPLVVSGLAYGIDIAAHKACLKNSLPTLGVLAHGLDRIYPSAHRTIAQNMLEQGGLITEFPSQTNPDRENFPKRNRLIAGLADATIVVEAGLKGGALITAELANSYNRDVFAFPGRVGDFFSSGCNFLIKTNRANLITDGADLEYILGWKKPTQMPQHQTQLPLSLNPEEQKIYDLLAKHQSVHVDQLRALSSFSQSKLVSVILNLEMKSLIKCLPGNLYTLA